MAHASLAGLLRRLRLHSHVEEQDAQALLGLPFATMTRDQYAHIMREGDPVLHCYVLLSGLVERHRLESNGGKQILAIYIPGDPLNLDHLWLESADDGFQTLKASELACIKLGDMRDLMNERPSLAGALSRAFAVDASIFRE
jgi:CRP-like cAMP-binding protein